MKLDGFEALQLGSIEVNPTQHGAQLRHTLTVCSCCDYCCPRMYLADCGHVFCPRCIVELASTDESDLALCTICRCSVATMEVPIQEKFIAHLKCVCPSCETVLRVKELRDHFTTCVTRDESMSTEVRTAEIKGGDTGTLLGGELTVRISDALNCQEQTLNYLRHLHHHYYRQRRRRRRIA